VNTGFKYNSLKTDNRSYPDFVATHGRETRRTYSTAARFVDWSGFNGTFSTNRQQCAFDKYVAAKKSDNVTCWETYNEAL